MKRRGSGITFAEDLPLPKCEAPTPAHCIEVPGVQLACVVIANVLPPQVYTRTHDDSLAFNFQYHHSVAVSVTVLEVIANCSFAFRPCAERVSTAKQSES